MQLTINGALLDATQVAICLMLGSMLLFALQYFLAGGWYREMLGWSVAIERLAFIGLLALLVVQQYWPQRSAAGIQDYLLAEAVLLFVSCVGINMGNAVMYDLRRHPVVFRDKQPPAASAGRQP